MEGRKKTITIQTVKEQVNENNELIGYLLNGTMSVPKADSNREYEAIKQWLEEGNIPEPEFAEEELQAQELAKHIQEYKNFLDKTDKKVMPYYEFEEGDNTLEWYVAERSKAREFIRINKGGN